MSNILLTTKCTRSCPYCFAEKEMAGSTPVERMTWENLIYIADFLHASGDKHVSFLGGEPTLHQDFVDIILYFIERNFDVSIFSNGFMPASRLLELKDHLTVIPPERFTIVCNLNDPDQTPASPREINSIHNFLSLMGPWTMAGFNIYRLDFNIEFLLEMINRYGMKRNLRLGIAHPMPGRDDGYIRSENIGTVINRLYSYRHLFDRFRVKPGLDCGFPLCRFTDEQLGWLFRLSGQAKFGCGPAIDIAPDMSVYSCFPLSNFHRKSFFEFDSMKQIADYYRQLQNRVRNEVAGIYDECDGCVHRHEGACAGGGICQLLHRFAWEPKIRIPEIEDELPKTHMPL